MDRVTVVHIITKLELGGAQENTLFTVAHLSRIKYDPMLISGTDGMLVEDARKLTGVGLFLIPELVREIRPLKDFIAFLKMVGVLRRLQQGKWSRGGNNHHDIIVHTHSSKAGILGRWAAKIAGVACIVHSVHGFSFHKYQPSLVRAFYIFMERLTACITTAFIVVSNANREEGIQRKIFTADKVSLIRSGIDIGSFQAVNCDKMAIRAGVGIEKNGPLVAMIACFKPQKAPLDFIRVARLVLDDLHEVQFLLVGDGVLRPRIEALINELGMSAQVHLAGWRRDIPQIMHSIDVLVLTSLWEGLPRVIPQAMAAGIPVVASDVDGSGEAIRDGVNGFILHPGDIAGMAGKVIYLLKHPEQAHAMGAKGRGMVEEYDSWKMVEQQEKLYASLMRTNGIEDHCLCL